MKLSTSLIIKIIIYGLICVVAVGIVPVKTFVQLQGKAAEEGIETFRVNAEIADSIFHGEFAEMIPKSIEGFDLQRLKEFGTIIDTNFDEEIRRIKEPFGNPWITYALGKSITGLLKQMTISILYSEITNSMISAVISIIGFIVMILIFVFIFPVKCIKKSVDNFTEQNFFSGFLLLLSFATVLFTFVVIAYTIMVSIPESTKFITSPPTMIFGNIPLGISYYFMTLHFLLGILVSVFLVMHFFRRKQVGAKRLYSLILLIPIISLSFNLWSSTKRIASIPTTIDNQNLNTSKQQVIQDCNELMFNARTFYLFSAEEKKVSLEDFNLNGIVSATEFGLYKLSVIGNILTIEAAGKYTDDSGKSIQAKAIYNAQEDSVKTEIIQ